jgi:hypothetical protein
VVAELVEGPGDGRVVDLAGAGLAAAGDVGDLDLADDRPGPAEQLDQVPLADLGVVQVEHHPQPRPIDGLDQGEGVGGAGERHPGMVDGGVEVLQAEGDPDPLPQPGHPLQRPGRGHPHGAGDLLDRPHRQPPVVQPGAVEVEPGQPSRSATATDRSAVASSSAAPSSSVRVPVT